MELHPMSLKPKESLPSRYLDGIVVIVSSSLSTRSEWASFRDGPDLRLRSVARRRGSYADRLEEAEVQAPTRIMTT